MTEFIELQLDADCLITIPLSRVFSSYAGSDGNAVYVVIGGDGTTQAIPTVDAYTDVRDALNAIRPTPSGAQQ